MSSVIPSYPSRRWQEEQGEEILRQENHPEAMSQTYTTGNGGVGGGQASPASQPREFSSHASQQQQQQQAQQAQTRRPSNVSKAASSSTSSLASFASFSTASTAAMNGPTIVNAAGELSPSNHFAAGGGGGNSGPGTPDEDLTIPPPPLSNGRLSAASFRLEARSPTPERDYLGAAAGGLTSRTRPRTLSRSSGISHSSVSTDASHYTAASGYSQGAPGGSTSQLSLHASGKLPTIISGSSGIAYASSRPNSSSSAATVGRPSTRSEFAASASSSLAVQQQLQHQQRQQTRRPNTTPGALEYHQQAPAPAPGPGPQQYRGREEDTHYNNIHDTPTSRRVGNTTNSQTYRQGSPARMPNGSSAAAAPATSALAADRPSYPPSTTTTRKKPRAASITGGSDVSSEDGHSSQQPRTSTSSSRPRKVSARSGIAASAAAAAASVAAAAAALTAQPNQSTRSNVNGNASARSSMVHADEPATMTSRERERERLRTKSGGRTTAVAATSAAAADTNGAQGQEYRTSLTVPPSRSGSGSSTEFGYNNRPSDQMSRSRSADQVPSSASAEPTGRYPSSSVLLQRVQRQRSMDEEQWADAHDVAAALVGSRKDDREESQKRPGSSGETAPPPPPKSPRHALSNVSATDEHDAYDPPVPNGSADEEVLDRQSEILAAGPREAQPSPAAGAREQQQQQQSTRSKEGESKLSLFGMVNQGRRGSAVEEPSALPHSSSAGLVADAAAAGDLLAVIAGEEEFLDDPAPRSQGEQRPYLRNAVSHGVINNGVGKQRSASNSPSPSPVPHDGTFSRSTGSTFGKATKYTRARTSLDQHFSSEVAQSAGSGSAYRDSAFSTSAHDLSRQTSQNALQVPARSSTSMGQNASGSAAGSIGRSSRFTRDGSDPMSTFMIEGESFIVGSTQGQSPVATPRRPSLQQQVTGGGTERSSSSIRNFRKDLSDDGNGSTSGSGSAHGNNALRSGSMSGPSVASGVVKQRGGDEDFAGFNARQQDRLAFPAAEFDDDDGQLEIVDAEEPEWATEKERRKEEAERRAEEEAMRKQSNSPHFRKRLSRRSNASSAAGMFDDSSYDHRGPRDGRSSSASDHASPRRSLFSPTGGGKRFSSVSKDAPNGTDYGSASNRAESEAASRSGFLRKKPSVQTMDTSSSVQSPDGSVGKEAVKGSYAIDPPTVLQLFEASNKTLLNENGTEVKFGDLWKHQRTLVCFLRHWYCPFCQQFAMSIGKIDPMPLKRAGLQLIVVGQGSWSIIKAYKAVMGVNFDMYADPDRSVYKALGITMRTNDPGPSCALPDYVQYGMTKSNMVAIKKILLKMPVVLPGDIKLLGGEFILGPGLQCTFTHRMTTVRGHLDIERTLKIAGCDLSLKSSTSVMEEGTLTGTGSRKMLEQSDFYARDAREDMAPSRAESTKSLGRKGRKFGKIFSRRRSKSGDSEYDDDYTTDGDDFGRGSDVPDGRRSAQSFSLPKRRKDRMSWNPFSSSGPGSMGSGNTSRNREAQPPMPENAIAVISAANSVRGSEDRGEYMREPEALQSRSSSGLQADLEAPSPMSANSMLPPAISSSGHGIPTGRLGNGVSEANTFKDLTAAALRPMPKEGMLPSYAGDKEDKEQPPTPTSYREDRPSSRAAEESKREESKKGSPREEEEEEEHMRDGAKTPTEDYSSPQRRSREGRVNLSDISRTTSQVIEPRSSEDGYSEAPTRRSEDTADYDISPQASLRGTRGPFASLSANGSAGTLPGGAASAGRQSPHMSIFDGQRNSLQQDKDLPVPPPAISVRQASEEPMYETPLFNASGSFLDSLDVVDGFTRHQLADDMRPAKETFFFDGSDNEESERGVDDRSESDIRRDGDSDGPLNRSDEELGDEDDDEAESTIMGHQSNGGTTTSSSRQQELSYEDDELEPEDEEDNFDYGKDRPAPPVLGGGLSITSMRPTLSPTPEEEDDEEEQAEEEEEEEELADGDGDDDQRIYGFGNHYSSGRPSGKILGNLARPPSGNLGTFMEEEEEGIEEEDKEEEQRSTADQGSSSEDK